MSNQPSSLAEMAALFQQHLVAAAFKANEDPDDHHDADESDTQIELVEEKEPTALIPHPQHQRVRATAGVTLNKAQSEVLDAVLDDADDPIQVIAGAGSGKTRTIIAAVVELVRGKVNPHRILVVTFTRKAAEEVKGRLKDALGWKANQIRVTTLHGLCWGLLRKATNNPRYNHLLGSEDSDGYPYAAKASRLRRPIQIVKTILKNGGPTKREKVMGNWEDVAIKDENGRDITFCSGLALDDPDPRAFTSAIGLLHANCIDCNAPDETIRKTVERILDPQVTHYIPYVYRAYEKAKVRLGVIGFEDMLTLFRREILEQPDRLREHQEMYDVVFVDEAQDLNLLQARIARALATRKTGKLGKLVQVGDQGQAIFAWNGALPGIFGEFGDEERVRRICLNINYRSTRMIVEMGQRLCHLNPNQYHYDMGWVLPEEDNIRPVSATFVDTVEEAAVHAERIAELIADGLSPEEIACLVRVNALTGPISIALLSRGIPIISPRSASFFNIGIVKQCIAYLRAVDAYQRGEYVSGEDIVECCSLPKRGLGQAFCGPIRKWRGDALEGCEWLARKDKRHRKGQDLADLIRRAAFSRSGIRNTLQTAWEVIENAIMLDAQREAKIVGEDDSESDTLSVFGQIISGFHKNDIPSFLELAMDSQQATMGDDDSGKGKKAVVISTVHRAKGGEWKNVTVLGLAEGIFPHSMSTRVENGLEEERRLFYVAVTRAKTDLTLSWPGSFRGRPLEPSSFFEEALVSGEGLEEFLKLIGEELEEVEVVED